LRLRDYIFVRLVHTLITVFIVIVLLFVIFRLMPGDPAKFAIDPKLDENGRCLLGIQMGIYEPAPGEHPPCRAVPLWKQFPPYLAGMLTFDFGNSFVTHQPVSKEIAERLPYTLLLFGTAQILGTLLSVMAGIVMAWHRGSKLEVAGIVTSLFFFSMPLFWFGLLLLMLFFGWWGLTFGAPLFPIGGFGGYDEAGEPLPFPANALDVLWHMALPLLTLMLLNLAGGILLMRNAMLEILGEDYISTARAKGLSERRIMMHHAARNAMLPVVTSVALSTAGVVSGGVLTETVFSWPGMGLYLVQRTTAYDYPAIQAAFFILALITIISNWAADLLYAWLDPRIRL
jgi:peptide/nickel transport system permease protein